MEKTLMLGGIGGRYFTDETGYLILPQNLDAGHYRIEEVTAPDGYTLNENYYEVSVASDTAYQMDSISGDVIIEVVYENHPVKGELQIVKKGEILEDFDKDFSYQEINLFGAVFDLYAAEDIYTADGQKDEQGNRILEYAAGTKVATLTTDQEGKASVSDLPLGTYEVVEITAPEGFVKNPEPQKVVFKYKRKMKTDFSSSHRSLHQSPLVSPSRSKYYKKSGLSERNREKEQMAFFLMEKYQ